MQFSELSIDPDIVETLEESGITEAFPIQEQTIPLSLSGQDIIGQAKTGTGKTLAFGLPLIQRLGTDPAPGIKALVVVPTRELAVQVFQDLTLACSKRSTGVVAIYGGKAYEGQIKAVKDGAQIVVGTPGRLLDLIQQRVVSLAEVSEVVLDEADKMLDLGFLSDIETIFSKLPAVRHTMLFSATMPGPIIALARRFMNRPIHMRAGELDDSVTQRNIKHLVYRAHPLDKVELIARALQSEGRGKTIIFMRTKRQAANLQEALKELGFEVTSVHGDLDQDRREKAMKAFKSGSKDVLIATDIAARGIDVDDVTHVINHTIPDDHETYLHRVGRTGRAGRTGIAVTLVDWDDLHKWSMISRALELGSEEPVETYSSSAHLFEDLNIPEGTKGRLPGTAAAPTTERTERRAPRSNSGASNRGGRGRQRTRPSDRPERSAERTSGAERGAESKRERTDSEQTASSRGERAPRRRRRRSRSVEGQHVSEG